MTKNYKKLGLALMMAASYQLANAQGEAAAIMKAGKQDANKIMSAYMTPMMEGFASTANIGWYNTAKPHGILGFDFTFSMGVFVAPQDARSYSFTDLQLGAGSPYGFTPANNDTDPNKRLPTLFGDKTTPNQRYNMTYGFGFDTIIGGTPTRIDTSVVLGSITMPNGSGIGIAPGLPPTLQFAVGIPKNTEIMVRYMPPINAEGFRANMFGMGVKHSIKQWIPVFENIPLWDWSFVGGYNTFSSSYQFQEANRLKASANSDYANAYNFDDFKNKPYDNQAIEFNGRALMLGTVVSVKLGPFTPYLGLNYNRATVDFGMVGDYPVLLAETNRNSPDFGKPKIEEISNPIQLSGSVNGLRINPGFRLKFLLMTIHYDYSYNTYGFNVHTAGIGINVQSLVPPKL
jgi:hypothetical protein